MKNDKDHSAALLPADPLASPPTTGALPNWEQRAFYAGTVAGWHAARRHDLRDEPIIPAAPQYLAWREFEDSTSRHRHRWLADWLRSLAQRLESENASDRAEHAKHSDISKYRKGALMQQRENLKQAADALEELIGSGTQATQEHAPAPGRSAAKK